MKKIATLLVAAAVGTGAAWSATPLWLRDVKISPDGTQIAFTYKGDIYIVNAEGGDARRLTSGEAYETQPVWSPDGKSIAYASDLHGNFDVMLIDVATRETRRLTTASAPELPQAFTPEGDAVLFSAAIQAPASSAMFPSGRMTQVYSVGVEGGASKQVLPVAAQMISVSADGKKVVYQDDKGMEDEWRKHHTSSATRDIWVYDTDTRRYTNLTSRGGEDRNPVLSADGTTVYFLSERGDGASMNVYSFPLANPQNAKQLTCFADHPVRFLSRAANGRMAFAYDGEIYTMDSDMAEPRKVAIDISRDHSPQTEKMRISPREPVASPDGKMVAFISRGDVFVTPADYSTTKQISSTPALEKQITWGKDGRTLYYVSERDSLMTIYRASLGHQADPNFANATVVDEKPLFPSDGVERSQPQVSPDGKSIAYVADRTRLMVADLKTLKARQVGDISGNSMRTGELSYEWSPDSRWLVAALTVNRHDPYNDIVLINASDGQLINLTESGYSCDAPRFVLGGDAVVYTTEKYGMRNHASWGSLDDVMIVFLNRKAYDRFRLNEEDFALLKDSEKEAEKAAKKEKEDKKTSDKDTKKGKSGKKDAKEDSKTDKGGSSKAAKEIVVEPQGLANRTERLTPFSSSITDAILSDDGETLYYITRPGRDYEIWKVEPRKDEVAKVTAVGGKGTPYFDASADGKTLFVFARGTMKKFDAGKGKLTDIKTEGSHRVDLAAERSAMYSHVVKEIDNRFYRTDLHGVDWPMYTAAYARFLPHIDNNYDFAELLSELLGELNASHTGGRYRPSATSQDDRTAQLGLLYDMTYAGPGLKVDEVVAAGPFDRADSQMKAGAVIEKIDGTDLTPDTDMAEMLLDKADKKTLVSFRLADGTAVEEVVRPITSRAAQELMYDRWVAQRAADVDRWSDGRLGYVHIASMSDDSFRPVYADLLGKYYEREGVVVDIRFNGGGRMHEDIEVLLSGEKYLTQVVRDTPTCDMPSRRWNKPSIMVTAEPCYSNAHGTPWVYKHQGIGKIVGMPVAGTMTSVNWETLQDPTLVYGIPVVGYLTAEGNYLENTQLEPDIRVVNAPEAVAAGEDLQLRAAVEELLREIDSQKK